MPNNLFRSESKDEKEMPIFFVKTLPDKFISPQVKFEADDFKDSAFVGYYFHLIVL